MNDLNSAVGQAPKAELLFSIKADPVEALEELARKLSEVTLPSIYGEPKGLILVAFDFNSGEAADCHCFYNGEDLDVVQTLRETADKLEPNQDMPAKPRICRVCGCTDDDCSQCVAAQGYPCHWVEDDLCSRCAAEGVS